MIRSAAVAAAVVVIALSCAATAGAKTISLEHKNVAAFGLTQAGSLADNAPVASCNSTKPTPALASTSSIPVAVHVITQSGPGTRCVQITLDGGSCGANSGARAVAYQPQFDEESIASNYKADSAVASPVNPARSFSFLAAPGLMNIAVHGAGTSGLCPDYSLTVRSPPNVDTDAATSVADTSALLHGTVNEELEESTTHFEYGTTTTYGDETTPSGLIGAPDEDNHNVTRSVAGLSPNTVYHYRTVVDYPASGSFPAGTSFGNDQTLHTTGDPTATTGAASSITTDRATLNDTVNPGGVATTSTFEYGKTTSYGTTTPPQPAGSDFSDHSLSSDVSGLEPGTTYHFRAVADQGGTVVRGDDATFTTAALPTVAAPEVTAAAATPAGGGPGAVVTPDLAAPSFAQGPNMSPSRFKAAKRGASVVQAAATGTRVSYSLSEPATVAFTVERAAPGRKVKGRCTAPSSRNRKAKKCVRFVKVKGAFSHNGAAGVNSFRFTGRVGGKALRPGSYRLVALATDAAGNRSAPKRASFKIVR
jgi:hypothetical protein